jgi:hypothetical protein
VMDPENGLRRKGWLPIKGKVEDGGMVMRFAVGDKVQKKIDSREIDDACWGKAQYDHHPGYVESGSEDVKKGKPSEMVPIRIGDGPEGNEEGVGVGDSSGEEPVIQDEGDE